MNKLFFLLLCVFSLSTASRANARNRPKRNLRHAFHHSSGDSKGRNNRAHFRRLALRPVIDLNPHTLEKFKTARAGRSYKFAKAR